MEDAAVADAHGDEDDDAFPDWGVFSEEGGETSRDREKSESEDDDFTVALSSRDVLAGADGGEGLGACERNGEICRLHRREAADVLVVQGQIVQIAVEYEAEEEILNQDCRNRDVSPKGHSGTSAFGVLSDPWNELTGHHGKSRNLPFNDDERNKEDASNNKHADDYRTEPAISYRSIYWATTALTSSI